MATQAITDQGYRAAYNSYIQYCNTRGIQPDPAFLNSIAAQYGYSGTLPGDVSIHEVNVAEMARLDRAENIRQFNINVAEAAKQAALDRAAAEKDRAQWAAAYTQAAAIGNQGAMAQAAAQVEAAGINAAAAIETANIAAEASRYSDDMKHQIAQEANELERQRVAAIEFARPSDWAARIGYMRGQTPEQAAALTKYAGGTVFGGAMPGTAAALPAVQPATAGAAPAALVGEPGPSGEARPELASALPGGGVQITPLQQQQAQWLRGQGLPKMAGGGAISWPSGGRYGGSATLPNPTGAVRSQLLDPSQMHQAMVGFSKTPEEYLARERRAYQFVSASAGRPGTTQWGAGVGQGGSLPATAGTTTAGGTVAPATTGGTTTPAATTPIDQLPFLEAGRAGGQYNVAPFQAWTGERTFPAMGINKPIPTPWEFNLMQWNNMARAEQAMWAGLWRKAMMIPGETEEEMLANAREAIGRSAFTGMASALPQYGGW